MLPALALTSLETHSVKLVVNVTNSNLYSARECELLDGLLNMFFLSRRESYRIPSDMLLGGWHAGRH